MAKRREKPALNPLQEDLIAAAVAPVDQATPVSAGSTRGASPEKGGELKRPNSTFSKSASAGIPRRERPTKTMRVRFPDTEFQENADVIKALRKLMGGSKVTESDVTRALWSLVRQAEETMDEMKGKAPKMRRPPNGDWVAKAEYDDAVAHFLHLAIKRLGSRGQSS